jgi:hypothetical protein
MNIEALRGYKRASDVRAFAVSWQAWMSKRKMSYGELLKWQGELYNAAKKCGVVREFKENGII